MSLRDDNQELIALAHNPISHTCTKHMDIQYYYIYDKIASEKIDLQYMLTPKIIANRLTKALI